MAYQPLTEEQFNKAQEAGFSTEQIISMEQRRKQESVPMFKNESEGRIASKKLQEEQSQLQDAASWPGFIRNQIIGGINTGINTATGGLMERGAGLAGYTTIPPNTTSDIQAAGMVAGMGLGIPAMAARGTGILLNNAPAFVRMAAQGATGGASVIPTMQQQPTASGALGQMALQSAIGGGVGAAVQPLSQLVPNVVNFSKGLITGPQRATQAGQEAIAAAYEKAAGAIKGIQKTGSMKIDIAQDSAAQVQKGYEDLSATLKKQVSRYSDAEAQQLQKDLPRIFGKKSQEYGDKLKEIVESLPADKSSVPASRIVHGMEESLVDHGVLRYEANGQLIQARTTLTPTEEKILSLYNNTRTRLADNPSASIDIQDLIKNQQYLRPKFGKAWTPDDKLGASVAENISRNVEDVVPEIGKLRSEYRPFLEWKKQAIKDIQPFSSQYDTTRASTLLGKVGSPSIKPDEQRLVAQLEQTIGRQVGNGRIAALNKGIQQTSQNQASARELSQQAVDKLKQQIANDIDNIKQNRDLSVKEIDAATNKLVQKYKNQRILTGIGLGGVTWATGGKLWEYFVRREAWAGLHGNY